MLCYSKKIHSWNGRIFLGILYKTGFTEIKNTQIVLLTVAQLLMQSDTNGSCSNIPIHTHKIKSLGDAIESSWHTSQVILLVLTALMMVQANTYPYSAMEHTQLTLAYHT